MEELFQLANQAKQIKAYEVANLVFAFLLKKQFIHEANFRFRIETQDECGDEPHQSYYDLLWIMGENPGMQICIPIPLINKLILGSLLKWKIRTMDPIFHERNTSSEFTEEEQEALYEKFRELTLLSEEEVTSLKKEFLS